MKSNRMRKQEQEVY